MFNYIFYGFLILLSVLIQFSFYDKGNEAYAPNIAVSLLRSGWTISILVLVFIYYNEWKRVSANSYVLKLFKYTLFPYSILFWSTGYSYTEVMKVDALLYLLILIYLYWFLLFDVMAKQFKRTVSLRDKDKELFFSVYPPKERSDMFGVDMAMLFVFVLPLIGPVGLGF